MQLMQGDCLELMKDIPDGAIDMILCDLPYGTTQCKWDSMIPFDKLWEQYKRIAKEHAAIVLFGTEPFSSYLRVSNIKNYRYDWIWEKSKATGFLNSKKQPMRAYEIISIFSKGVANYYPQGLIKGKYNTSRPAKIDSNKIKIYGKEREYKESEYSNYPINIIKISSKIGKRYHTTQKPVELLEYLIKTYTNEGETVLDNCMGSGSTGVACVNIGRDFIGIELDTGYFDIAKKRIEDAQAQIRI